MKSIDIISTGMYFLVYEMHAVCCGVMYVVGIEWVRQARKSSTPTPATRPECRK